MDASKAFADSTKFYFTLHKEKVGPYDLAAMKAEYKNGNLRPGTYVWYKALGRTWLKLQVTYICGGFTICLCTSPDLDGYRFSSH